MVDTAAAPPGSPSPPRLQRRLGLATGALVWERLWPALWPILCVGGFFLAFALFDLSSRVPAGFHGNWRPGTL